MKNNVMYKNKKYFVQFPEGVTAEQQAEYMKKVQNNMENEDFIVIDPKIKLYDAQYKMDVNKDDKKNTEENKSDDANKDNKDDSKAKEPDKKESDSIKKDESIKDPATKSDNDVKIEKVDATQSKDLKEPTNILMGENGESGKKE